MTCWSDYTCDSLAKKYFPFRNLLYLCSHNQSEGLVAMDA